MDEDTPILSFLKGESDCSLLKSLEWDAVIVRWQGLRCGLPKPHNSSLKLEDAGYRCDLFRTPQAGGVYPGQPEVYSQNIESTHIVTTLMGCPSRHQH